MAATKLNGAGRLVVIERVIAGDTNNEIRKRLRDAGYLDGGDSITDATLTGYRKSKDVKAAIERKYEEAVQSGYSQRSERILRLAKSARRFEARLADGPDDAQFAIEDNDELVKVHKGYLDTLAAIGELVDPKKPQPLVGPDGEGAVKITSPALEAAAAELAEWRKQMTDGLPTDDLLSSPSAPPT